MLQYLWDKVYFFWKEGSFMQAIMLAAGKGSRLGKYTKDNTKCMLEVNGITLLERAIDALCEASIEKFILVLGYKKDNVKRFISEKGLDKRINIIYVDNDIYDKTNNIYSLYLAKDYLENDDTILLESDIIYEKNVIKNLVDSPFESAAVIAKYKEWMDGTVVTLDDDSLINSFVEKKDFNYSYVDSYFKTVNIYKFSREFSRKYYLPFLESYIKTYGNNDYYELVLKVIISGLKDVNLYGFVLDEATLWYEIDDVQDLDIASSIFAPSANDKLSLYSKRFGGYWRFNNLKDYCYLVNPYFPCKKMLDKMKYFYNDLLFNYPSGQRIQKICASRMFDNISEDNILIGNGAAELINTLKYVVKGKIGLSIPSFNEYVRCFPDNEILYINTNETGYRLSYDVLLEKLEKVDSLVIISPDNPTGSCLTYEEIIGLLEVANKKNKQVIFDESFIDFAKESYTLINDSILNKYTNLIVIKSISKSYGVPGLRLGALATSNREYMEIIYNNMPVWNINSFAEYFLQIFPLYKKDYKLACDKIKEERDRFYLELCKFNNIKVYKSDANYFMCKLENIKADDLAGYLLEKYNILIKVLNGKSGFDNGEYIRIAVKNFEENNYLLDCIKKYNS